MRKMLSTHVIDKHNFEIDIHDSFLCQFNCSFDCISNYIAKQKMSSCRIVNNKKRLFLINLHLVVENCQRSYHASITTTLFAVEFTYDFMRSLTSYTRTECNLLGAANLSLSKNKLNLCENCATLSLD